VYNERILRQKCREMKNLVSYPNFTVHYSAKANCNLALLQIIRSEGLSVDAMTPGEIFAEIKAGYSPDQIFYVSNNMSEDEMRYAIDRGILTSVDSLLQLERFGRLNPGGKVSLRFNPGIGAGYHENIITAGKDTKFGVEDSAENITLAKKICREHGIKLVGLNMHIGSDFMEGESYIQASRYLAQIAKNFDDLEFIDLGGGFGIPYMKRDGQQGMDLDSLGNDLSVFMHSVSDEYGKKLEFKIEPGRYVVAESSVLLGYVHDVKLNHGIKYIGTDIGFNVLIRPMMYDAYHDIEIYSASGAELSREEAVTVVGNICETGDILAKGRLLPETYVGDIVCILDAGAYGHAMSSNYNHRLRPAEVLIRESSEVALIRERDTMEDLVARYVTLY